MEESYKINKLKIAVVSHDSFWPLRGGGGIRVYWVIKKMLERGHDVVVLAPLLSNEGLKNEFPNLKIKNLGKISRFTKHKELTYLKLIFKIFYELLKIKPDIIYAHNVVAGFPSWFIAKFKRIPIVFDMDDIQTGLSKNKVVSRLGPRLEYFIARHATKTIVMSKALARVLEMHGVKNIDRVSHGVDLDLFKPMNEIKKENLIIYQGGVEEHDGTTLIPKAAKYVIQQVPDIKFMILGNGKALPLVKREVKELNLTKNFIFKEWVDHKDIPKYLAKSKIGLVTHLKNLACDVALVLKGLEYMGVELPMIAPDLAGMKEEVGKNERGLIFKCGDSKDLANKIIYLLKRPQLQEQLGKHGRKFVLENCNWDNNAKKIVNICENCRKAI